MDNLHQQYQNFAQFGFPKLAVTEAEKDENWHKQWVLAITHQGTNTNYDTTYYALSQCYDYYNGTQTGEEFKFLQEAEDGDVLPARWDNINKMKVKVDVLTGEMIKRGHSINVRAQNKDAVGRRIKEKVRMQAKMYLQPFTQQLEEEYGLPLQSESYIPQNEDELQEYYENYKEQSEIIMQAALKFTNKRNKWENLRKELSRDMFITGRCFAINEVKNGLPVMRRIDPRKVIFDKYATDDLLSDSSYFGIVEYLNIADVAETFNLTSEELMQAYHEWKTGKNAFNHKANHYRRNNLYNLISHEGVEWFQDEDNEIRILVIRAFWVDTKRKAHKESVDKYGNEHFTKVSDAKKDKENIKRTTLKTWRQGTLIGGMIFKEWGEVKNLPRSVDSIHDTEPPIKGCIPNYVDCKGVSMVMSLMKVQDMKGILDYSIKLALARAGGKGFVYDVSQRPEGWTNGMVIKYLKTVGIAFIDSRQDGQPTPFNQFQSIDMTLSASVEQYISLSRYYDNEMDTISGVNEARQGVAASASEAVGVRQSSLVQSSLVTENLFDTFRMFSNNVMNYQAGLIKIVWPNKERFAEIIGETGIDFLKNDIDLQLNDYGVFVEVLPPLLEDKQDFRDIVLAALQSGSLGQGPRAFLTAMKLLREKDINVAIRKFEKEVEKQELVQQQQQQQEMAMQQQIAEQQFNNQMQLDQNKEQTKGDYKLRDTAMKNQNLLQTTIAKGRFDLNKQRIGQRAPQNQ